jgi:hypothetical protein
MKKLTIVFILLSTVIQAFSQQNKKYLIFIEKYKDLAIKEQYRHGIPAAVTMAQAILESDVGQSMLAVKGKNFFGIKCGGNWTGKTITKDDDNIQDCFRKYDDITESYEDHSKFLLRPRYDFLFNYPLNDYQLWAKGLQKAGYATDKNYADKLIKLIEDYNLQDLYNITNNKNEIRNNDNVNTDSFDYLMTQTYNNGIKCYKLKQDATIEDVAVALGKKNVKILLTYNDMFEDGVLKQGTYVYVQKKKGKAWGSNQSYNAKIGDSMHSISQRYGITLKALYKLNRLPYGTSAKEGMTLYLQ